MNTARISHTVVFSLKLAVIVGLVVTSGCLSNVASDDTAPTTHEPTATTASGPTPTDSPTTTHTTVGETEGRDETTTESEESQGIEISHVIAYPPVTEGGNFDKEFIELTNTGEQAIDMTGWTVEDEDNNTFHFPDGFTLAAGESVKIYSAHGQNTSNELYWNASEPIWDNDGDTIYVYNSSGEVCGMECIRLIPEIQ